MAYKKNSYSSGQCGSVAWASSCKAKGHWFNSQSGHMSGLQAESLVGAHGWGTFERKLINVSLPLFLPLFPSL